MIDASLRAVGDAVLPLIYFDVRFSGRDGTKAAVRWRAASVLSGKLGIMSSRERIRPCALASCNATPCQTGLPPTITANHRRHTKSAVCNHRQSHAVFSQERVLISCGAAHSRMPAVGTGTPRRATVDGHLVKCMASTRQNTVFHAGRS